MENKYYLGLDIGTSSLGWAVTNNKYELVRKGGKDLWGVHTFEEAKLSKERRNSRVSRRRRQRQVVRIGLLKDYFYEEIVKVDPNFFVRLDDSKYFKNDKDNILTSCNGIFNDEDYKDADYYKDYPTIFHLRSKLIHDKGKHDIRLIYLALLNMYKHRGHFLNVSLSTESSRSCAEIYTELVSFLIDENISVPQEINCDFLEEVLADTKRSKKVKYELLERELNLDKKNKPQVNIFKLLCGSVIKVKQIFVDSEIDDKFSITFTASNYEERFEEMSSQLSEEQIRIIELCKEIYDRCKLVEIMKGKEYLSDARIESYKKHHEDLDILKNKIYKSTQLASKRSLMFREEKDGTYTAYVKSNNTNGKTSRRPNKAKKGTRDDLYATIKKDLKDLPDSEIKKYVLDEIEKGTFLPKQMTFENGVIPNQVHAKEMKKILENAEQHYPFLKSVDDSGLTVSERILKLFTFTIPYYVGPTSINSKTGWVVRKEDGQVLPWNIEEKIDMNKTNEKFIENLIRRCSYISDEKVLPKASLAYERYALLNEINNLKIDGNSISVELKQDIYNSLFTTGKRVSKKLLAKYLVNRGLIEAESQLSGIDLNVNSSLASFGKFYAIFGEELKKDSVKNMVEDIIRLSTIYADDKKFLKKRLIELYENQLDQKTLKKILGFKFKDWGRLSKEFLELQGYNKQTGEVLTLLDALWSTNNNSMELINSDLYSFKENLESKQVKNLKTLSDFTIEDLEDMYFSAPVRRMLWRTIKLIKEIEHIMGAKPEKIFIEMIRRDEQKGDKGRKDSRKKQLEELYKSVKNDQKEWISIINKAESDGTLRSKKMYLYLLQQGRDMYTGETIDLDDLFNDNLYDIDHIYPQHYVKDDNLMNNLVLVKKQENANKSDEYPLKSSIRNNPEVKKLWKTLHDHQFINDEKYKRLTCSTPFTDEQKAVFVARQMVETGQSTKGLADILKQLIPNEETTIVYSKAVNVSDFRRDNELLKSRLVNDFHHAHDAYLNIVVGNAYQTKFTSNPLNYIKNRKYNNDFNYNLGKMFDRDIVRNGYTAWKANVGSQEGTIAIVKKVLAKNTPLMTRMSFEQKGALYDLKPISAEEAKDGVYMPLNTNSKMSDVEKYGGYNKVTNSYFFVVEHDDKKKRIMTIETVPTYAKDIIESNENGLLEYCRNGIEVKDKFGKSIYFIRGLGLKNPRIIYKKINYQSLIKVDGYCYYISGKSLNKIVLRNAVNMCLTRDKVNYIKKLENYLAAKANNPSLTVELYNNYSNKKNGKILIDRSRNIELYNEFVNKYTSSIFSKRQNYVGDKLKNKTDMFSNLKIDKQITVLLEILQLSNIGPTSANLEIIKEAAKTGVLTMNKKISNYNEFKVINTSITGFYKKEIDILDLGNQ